jgi:hypothetical protein
MRKLAPKVQACLQCLSKDSILRFGYSVDFDDVTFVREVIGDIARHEKPPSFARQPTYSNNPSATVAIVWTFKLILYLRRTTRF